MAGRLLPIHTGTDDLIAARPCLDQERRRHFASACAEKQHYKQMLCGLVIDAGVRAGSVARCVADPEFSGPIVRDDGARWASETLQRLASALPQRLLRMGSREFLPEPKLGKSFAGMAGPGPSRHATLRRARLA